MSRTGFTLVVYLGFLLLPLSHCDATFLALDFGFDNQTYTWTDSLSFSRALNDRNLLQFQNRSMATLIKQSVIGKGGDRWQKLARSKARFTHRFSRTFSGGVLLSQDFDRLEDRRYIGNSAFMFFDFEKKHFTTKQNTGIVWEQRKLEPNGSTQIGLGYDSEISLRPCLDGSLGRIAIDGSITLMDKTPRKAIAFYYDLSRSFTGKDTTTIRAMQEFGEREYFPVSGHYDATARQQTERRSFDFSSVRRFPGDLYLAATGFYRFVSYDYDYDNVESEFVRQNDNFNAVTEYVINLDRMFGKNLSVHGEYLFNRTREDFGSQQTNQKAETGQLSLSGTLTLFDCDTLQFDGRIGVTSYFAPTTSAFFSDRDRTIRLASFRFSHRFTPYLSAAMDGSFRGFHTIYISGDLSANNKVNNTYILNPSLTWRPHSGVALHQNYQLHAAYIYYDFEKSRFSGRNTIYRRANMINQLVLSPSVRTDFIIEYSYRYEDFGPLRYSDQWQQQVSWDRRTHRPRFSINYHPKAGITFQPYIVYEVQTSYDHLFDEIKPLGKRTDSDRFKRALVGFELVLALSPGSYIECDVQRRRQEYRDQPEQVYDRFTITIKRLL